MAAHAYLKNEFTEDKKCQNLMSWLICFCEGAFNSHQLPTSSFSTVYSETDETILTSTHNICFYAEIWKIIENHRILSLSVLLCKAETMLIMRVLHEWSFNKI